jgi:hypothetical protein
VLRRQLESAQPTEAAVVERDVGAAQQRRPGGLAGIVDDVRGHAGAAPDDLAQP